MAWERRKSSPKSAQKPAIFLIFAISLSFLSLSLHRGLQPPPLSSPVSPPSAPPQEASTTTNRPPRATVGFSLLSAAPPVFFFFFYFLCNRHPPPQPALPPSFPSTQLLTSGRVETVTFSLFSFQPFSLLYNFFLLPSTADSGHHHLSRCLLSHQLNHLITSETPKPGNFLLPALPLASSAWPLHAEFISACSI